jgi:hypothetical protein
MEFAQQPRSDMAKTTRVFWYRGINGFSIPSICRGRKPLVTLRDAAEYIMQLPEAERGHLVQGR